MIKLNRLFCNHESESLAVAHLAMLSTQPRAIAPFHFLDGKLGWRTSWQQEMWVDDKEATEDEQY